MSPPLFSYRKHWAKKLGTAPQLPMSREEMAALGWQQCDVILVSGDAYVDHPSFGAALIGRLLEAQGFRVGVIAQPDWRSPEAFGALGRPALFYGVTAGNMDSMVNRYTAERRRRSDDAYSPDDLPDLRPDRASIVYAQRCREASPDTPVVLGGIEASLRRLAHYDYWSDKVRRSILLDAKADLLLYGNAERAVVELAHRLARGVDIQEVRDLRGSAWSCARGAHDGEELDGTVVGSAPRRGDLDAILRLPSFEQVRADQLAYAHASRLYHLEAHVENGRALVQAHGERDVVVTPPPIPLSTAELDALYELPFSRLPHTAYEGRRLRAFEMIRFSVNICRGCFGGCSFCSLTEHEGRVVQSRSRASVLREIEAIRDRAPGFTGVISDLGGPTANMYRMGCGDPEAAARCRRPSCLQPKLCAKLGTDHGPLIRLYRDARALPGVKKVLIGSGLRYDLALRSTEYIRELAEFHVGGYLKVAPEHVSPSVLRLMQKPGAETYDRFAELFERFSSRAAKEQYLIPYLIAAHPGAGLAEMLEVALWLKARDLRPEQVQTFLPTPMSLATAMYHSERDPLRRLHAGSEAVRTARKGRERRMHKAFLRYHDPQSWALLREALVALGREELIGDGKRHLVPSERRGRPGPRGPRRPGGRKRR